MSDIGIFILCGLIFIGALLAGAWIRCVNDLCGYICGIERKDVMPFLGKKNRPDWCPIICQLPEGHERLIDADAYSAEMKDRQDAAWKWRNEAIAEEDEVKLARAEGAFTAFTEAKLTMDKHIINKWHRVEEELPEPHEYVLCCGKKGGCFVGWTLDNADVVKANGHGRAFVHGGNARTFTHWMPLPEPPKEDA